jgi:L-ribulokinase
MPAHRDDVVVGVDFGTLSARSLVARVADGTPLGVGVSEYEHGVLDQQLPNGQSLAPGWALQVPGDYVAALIASVAEALASAGVGGERVIGVGTAFTACTVLPVLGDGTPLCELSGFSDRPHAYAKLWKHHAAQPYADRLNEVAHDRSESWIDRYGGRLSAEWELAKGLEVLEEDPDVYRRMDKWVEASDWIVWQLCGVYVRNVCATGFKAAYQDGAYPSSEYFRAVNALFEGFIAAKVDQPIAQLGSLVGGLTTAMARAMGLPPGIAVCAGNVDAHCTAPAAQAIDPGQLLAIMGTSTCHVMVGDRWANVPGMCGVVADGIVPGRIGYEAGQSGVGDIFAWFINNCVPPAVVEEAGRRGRSVHAHLSELASDQPVGAHGLVALDWHSGNRSVLVDHGLSGVVLGQSLQTRPEEIYRALIEATAFGAKVIVQAFEREGLPVVDFVAAGGLVTSPFVMQIYADVLARPIHVIGSEQGAALGAAMHAAVAAGAYGGIEHAAAAMGRLNRDAWKPDIARSSEYEYLFEIYGHLHDHFGRAVPELMHGLHEQRRRARLL